MSNNSPQYLTRGGLYGHLLRRSIHVSMALIPWLFACWLDRTSALVVQHGLLIALLILHAVEALRLWKKWTFWGQREHERDSISSMAWGGFALVVVLLLAPRQPQLLSFSWPIVACCALVDPVLGEARRWQLNVYLMYLIGAALCGLIWYLASRWFQTPLGYLWPMVPITLISERCKPRCFDDNASMMLIPLLAVCLLRWLLY